MKTIAIITLMIMLHYDVKIMINIMKCAPSKRHSLVSVGKKNKKTKNLVHKLRTKKISVFSYSLCTQHV